MTVRLLLAFGSLIYLLLGTLHLLYTFFTPKFSPHDPTVETAMKNTNPLLTRQTTMWKAWIGFNASHSTGAMFFGFVNIFFAISAFPVFEQSLPLQAAALVNSFFFLWLARKYWFSIPLAGAALASIFYTLAVVLIHLPLS